MINAPLLLDNATVRRLLPLDPLLSAIESALIDLSAGRDQRPKRLAILGSGARVQCEIGEVLAGKVQVPAGVSIIFKALGQAVEDAVAARLVYAAFPTANGDSPS